MTFISNYEELKSLYGEALSQFNARRASGDFNIKTSDELKAPTKKEVRVVLRNSGKIDPLDICEYIAMDGYLAAGKTLTEMNSEQVIEEVLASGLRGRGGAGFPTGLKWRFARNAPNTPKYLICNADEGDPGAFMNRLLLETDPHAVIEGMMIAAFAIGSKSGLCLLPCRISDCCPNHDACH